MQMLTQYADAGELPLHRRECNMCVAVCLGELLQAIIYGIRLHTAAAGIAGAVKHGGQPPRRLSSRFHQNVDNDAGNRRTSANRNEQDKR